MLKYSIFRIYTVFVFIQSVEKQGFLTLKFDEMFQKPHCTEDYCHTQQVA